MKKAYIQPSTKAETITIDESILISASATGNGLNHLPGNTETEGENVDPGAREFGSVWDEE